MSLETSSSDFKNRIIHGDCIDIMATMPAGSIDMGLLDPPYIANYRARNGQTVANDDNGKWLKPAFAQLYRVLKPNSFCISFYGWPKVDLFMAAWKGAGFRVAGHIVFRKKYASKSAFLQYSHEAAYLLVKGNPAFPAAPLPDVMDWVYSRNKLHPTQKSIHNLKPLIQSFSKPGDIIIDPFAGSGSTLRAAALTGRNYVGIELDRTHHETASNRLQNTNTGRAA